jgi:hypothetical protein
VRFTCFIERCAIIPVLHDWDRRLGYVTVTPDLHFEVSRRIKEEFDNGCHYYELHGKPTPRSRGAALAQ